MDKHRHTQLMKMIKQDDYKKHLITNYDTFKEQTLGSTGINLDNIKKLKCAPFLITKGTNYLNVSNVIGLKLRKQYYLLTWLSFNQTVSLAKTKYRDICNLNLDNVADGFLMNRVPLILYFSKYGILVLNEFIDSSNISLSGNGTFIPKSDISCIAVGNQKKVFIVVNGHKLTFSYDAKCLTHPTRIMPSIWKQNKLNAKHITHLVNHLNPRSVVLSDNLR